MPKCCSENSRQFIKKCKFNAKIYYHVQQEMKSLADIIKCSRFLLQSMTDIKEFDKLKKS